MSSTKLLAWLLISLVIFVPYAIDLFNAYRMGIHEFHIKEHPKQSEEEFRFSFMCHWLVVIGFGISTVVTGALYIKFWL